MSEAALKQKEFESKYLKMFDLYRRKGDMKALEWLCEFADPRTATKLKAELVAKKQQVILSRAATIVEQRRIEENNLYEYAWKIC